MEYMTPCSGVSAIRSERIERLRQPHGEADVVDLGTGQLQENSPSRSRNTLRGIESAVP
jgi:hypothetical protein